VVVSVGVVWWLTRLPARGARFLACALALVLGGAIGNLYDRMTLGYVVDFILVHYQGWNFPAFNVADSAITVGAIMLIIDAFFLEKKRQSASA
jgi:signal peptidase II